MSALKRGRKPLNRKRRRRGSRLEDIVARRYEKAGYKVEKHKVTSAGEIDVLATRRKSRICSEVKSGRQIITSKEVLKLVNKASRTRSKPVLIIGPRVKLTDPAKRTASKHDVRIKKLKI